MQQLRALAKRKVLLAAIITGTVGILLVAGAGMRQVLAGQAANAAVDVPPAEVAFAAFDEAPADATAAPEAPAMVVVYVSGAVGAPDVYQLPADARIKDLVLAAGGLAPDADVEAINLASHVKDGDHVHIPRQGDAQEASAQAPEAVAAGAPAEADALIDVNAASAAQLDELPGIGPALANRIVEYRAANGPFSAVDDLRNVKGIGPALFASIAPLVTAGS